MRAAEEITPRGANLQYRHAEQINPYAQTVLVIIIIISMVGGYQYTLTGQEINFDLPIRRENRTRPCISTDRFRRLGSSACQCQSPCAEV